MPILVRMALRSRSRTASHQRPGPRPGSDGARAATPPPVRRRRRAARSRRPGRRTGALRRGGTRAGAPGRTRRRRTEAGGGTAWGCGAGPAVAAGSEDGRGGARSGPAAVPRESRRLQAPGRSRRRVQAGDAGRRWRERAGSRCGSGCRCGCRRGAGWSGAERGRARGAARRGRGVRRAALLDRARPSRSRAPEVVRAAAPSGERTGADRPEPEPVRRAGAAGAARRGRRAPRSSWTSAARCASPGSTACPPAPGSRTRCRRPAECGPARSTDGLNRARFLVDGEQ